MEDNLDVTEGLYDFEVCKSTDEEYRIVRQLISKFSELRFIPDHGDILVIRNNKRIIKDTSLQRGRVTVVNISKVPPKFRDILNQMNDTKDYAFMLEIAANAFSDEKLDTNQLTALIYFELRRIDFDGNLRKSGPNDWMRILHGLGKGFERLGNTCTNILETDFTWKSIMGAYYDQLEVEAEPDFD